MIDIQCFEGLTWIPLINFSNKNCKARVMALAFL